MMMAPDWTPVPPQPLPEELLDSVRRALTAFLENGHDTSTLQSALHELSAAARVRDMQPEQLLVMLKELWYGLPALAQTLPGDQPRLLQRVVTLCIKEYFGD